MFTRVRTFVVSVVENFLSDEVPSLAAALAFYLTLSFAPLAILFIAIGGLLEPEVVVNFGRQIGSLAGAGARDLFEEVVKNSKDQSEWSIFGRTIGFVSLAISASVIFGELRRALNRIFDIKTDEGELNFKKAAIGFFKQRLAHIGLVLSFLILLSVSLIASSALSVKEFTDQKFLAYLFNLSSAWLFFGLIFTLMIRFVPDVRQDWSSSVHGGMVIATLFLIGKELIGLYLGQSEIGSLYGAAGSGIVFLAWIYYSATVIFLGAEASFVASKQRRIAHEIP